MHNELPTSVRPNILYQRTPAQITLHFYLLSPFLSPGYCLSHLVHTYSYMSNSLCMSFLHVGFYYNVYSSMSFL